MMYVDQMQSVNNSFTNLASQLKSYKQGKLDYAKTMQEGLYSNGTPNVNQKRLLLYMDFTMPMATKEQIKVLMHLSKVQDGGNLAFNVGGQEISYNDMEEPFLKDTKLFKIV